jgi:hypothetical protein
MRAQDRKQGPLYKNQMDQNNACDAQPIHAILKAANPVKT